MDIKQDLTTFLFLFDFGKNNSGHQKGSLPLSCHVKPKNACGNEAIFAKLLRYQSSLQYQIPYDVPTC